MRYKKTGGVLILFVFGVSLIFAASLPLPKEACLPETSPEQTASPPTAEAPPEPNPQEETPGDPKETIIPHAPENREPPASAAPSVTPRWAVSRTPGT